MIISQKNDKVFQVVLFILRKEKVETADLFFLFFPALVEKSIDKRAKKV